MRCLSVLLLLVMLPSIALSALSGSQLCVGEDHVSSTCHVEPADSSACEDTSAPASTPADESDADAVPCVDLIIQTTDSSVAQPDSIIAPAAFASLLVEVAFGSAAIVSPAHFDDAGDDPPAFCARSFSSSIALRC